MNPIFGKNPVKALAVARALGALPGPEAAPEERARAFARAALAREPRVLAEAIGDRPAGDTVIIAGIAAVGWRIGPITLGITYRINNVPMLPGEAWDDTITRGLSGPTLHAASVRTRGRDPEEAYALLTAILYALDPDALLTSPDDVGTYRERGGHVVSYAYSGLLYTALSEAAGGEQNLRAVACYTLLRYLRGRNPARLTRARGRP